MWTQLITNDFIDRAGELDIFIRWLEDPDAPKIIYIYDATDEKNKKGGIGKTWLLNKYITLVRESPWNFLTILMDFFKVADRDGIVVAERIVGELQERYPGWSPQTFETSLLEYRNASLIRSLDTSRLRDQLGNALVADLQALNEQLNQTGSYLLVFFDTYELIEQDPIATVLCPHEKFPDNYRFERIRFVIAGRNELDFSHPNWQNRKEEILPIPLKPFIYDEMIEYLKLNAYDMESYTPQQLMAIHNLTGGRPILIGLVADVLNNSNNRAQSMDLLATARPAEFKEILIDQINYFDTPKKWIIFFMAHIYHRFNSVLLGMIMDKPSFKQLDSDIKQELLTALSTSLSFIRRSSNADDFVLHDEIRDLINQYCWPKQDRPDQQRIQKQLSDLAIEYYTVKIGQEQHEQTRQSYIVEMLYHVLFKNREEGLVLFEEHFSKAVELWMRAYARSLLQEVKKFTDRMTEEQKIRIIFAEARLLRIEENPLKALGLFQQLEGNSEWYQKRRIEVLFEKGANYQQLSRLPEAIASFEACLKIEETQENHFLRIVTLNELGYIYSMEGELSEAVRYYEASLNEQRDLDNPQEYANTLNSLGNIYRQQGRIEDALHHCKIGLQMRRKLFEEGKISERYIALSQSTVGQIYINRDDIIHGRDDIAQAEGCFREALDIYNRVGYKRGIAATYNRLGQVQMAREHWDQAMVLFKEAYDASLEIDVETRIISLNKQGRVLAHQEMWAEAIILYNQAIRLAEQAKHSFEEAESMLDLAEALQQMGESSQQVDQVLEKAMSISYKRNYYYLLARAEDIQGDADYKKQQYQKAFKHYRVACRYIALYSHPRYVRRLRFLLDALLNIPSRHLPGIIDLLTNYWYDYRMNVDYPEMLNICNVVTKHIVL